jgi:hypothetical protein
MQPLNAAFATRIEAMRLARNQVRQELKSQGQKVQYTEAAEITRLARIWFEGHRQPLVDVALRNVLADVLRANLRTSAQKSKARPARVSAVQISRSKVEA